MKHRFLWVIDPWQTLDHKRDTTLRLIEEGVALGAGEQWISEARSITWSSSAKGPHTVLQARQVLEVAAGRDSHSFLLSTPQSLEANHFTQIHYRVDPPVDHAWIHPLQMLKLGLGPKAERIVNPIEVLFSSNEKLEASALKSLMPESIASASREPLFGFVRDHRKVVLKPLHEAQSKGIELLDEADVRRCEDLLQLATADFTRPVQLQRYLAGIKKGETRIWFIDGRILAFVQKIPVKGDFRVNMDRGSALVKLDRLSDKERKTAAAISKHLRARKIRLAAVDLIEGLATDFNFTSPGLIPQMEQTLGQNLAKPIMRALAKK